MSLLSLLPFCSCARPDAHITTFSYHYDGTIGADSHTYTVRVNDEGATITIYDMTHHDYGEMTDAIDTSFVRALEELCKKHKVWRFDGFHKHNPMVCDGSGFSLYIAYNNGKSIDAWGMNRYPNGYREFSQEMYELFRPYHERMVAAAATKNGTEKEEE